MFLLSHLQAEKVHLLLLAASGYIFAVRLFCTGVRLQCAVEISVHSTKSNAHYDQDCFSTFFRSWQDLLMNEQYLAAAATEPLPAC